MNGYVSWGLVSYAYSYEIWEGANCTGKQLAVLFPNDKWEGPSLGIHRMNGMDTITYNDGLFCVFERQNGNIVGQCKEYKNGMVTWTGEKLSVFPLDERLNGQCIWYDGSTITKKATYSNGILNGPYETFYPNGNIKSSTYYNENGKEEGCKRSYDENGICTSAIYESQLNFSEVRRYMEDHHIVCKCEGSTSESRNRGRDETATIGTQRTNKGPVGAPVTKYASISVTGSPIGVYFYQTTSSQLEPNDWNSFCNQIFDYFVESGIISSKAVDSKGSKNMIKIGVTGITQQVLQNTSNGELFDAVITIGVTVVDGNGNEGKQKIITKHTPFLGAKPTVEEAISKVTSSFKKSVIEYAQKMTF